MTITTDNAVASIRHAPTVGVDLTDYRLYAYGDPHAVWRRLRTEAPVAWHPEADGPGFWVLTRHREVKQVYRDPVTFTSERGVGLDQPPDLPAPGSGQMVILSDPPRHLQQRRLMVGPFIPKAVSSLEPRTRQLLADILGELENAERCDFAVDVSRKLPLAVICELLGVPERDWELIFSLSNRLSHYPDPEYQTEGDAQATVLGALQELFAYFSTLVAERRSHRTSDLVGLMATGEINGQPLGDDEILWNCYLLVVAGNETTRNAASAGVAAFLDDPAQWERLRADRTLLDGAIEEVLRWASPVMHVMRVATSDTELGGQDIKAGDRVTLWNASANRDETVFPDPERFDIERRPNPHVAFGSGEHFCMGSHIARLELRCLFSALLDSGWTMRRAGPEQHVHSNLFAGIKHLPVSIDR